MQLTLDLFLNLLQECLGMVSGCRYSNLMLVTEMTSEGRFMYAYEGNFSSFIFQPHLIMSKFFAPTLLVIFFSIPCISALFIYAFEYFNETH